MSCGCVDEMNEYCSNCSNFWFRFKASVKNYLDYLNSLDNVKMVMVTLIVIVVLVVTGYFICFPIGKLFQDIREV